MTSEQIRTALQSPEGCPPLEQLAPGPGQARSEETLRHVEQCLHCQTELEMLEAFVAGEIRQDEVDAVNEIAAETRRRLTEHAPGTATRRSTWGSGAFRQWLPLAAALILGLVGLRLLTAPDAGIPLDPGPTGVVRQGDSVGLVAPLGVQASVPRRLVWRPFDGAASYRVTIRRVDGQPVWSAMSAGTEIELAPVALEAISPARRLLWGVEALAPDGSVLAGSEQVRFWLVAPGGENQ